MAHRFRVKLSSLEEIKITADEVMIGQGGDWVLSFHEGGELKKAFNAYCWNEVDILGEEKETNPA